MPARTHGRTNTKEYRTWENMKKRCYCKTDQHYPRWGGRGIYMCDEWRFSFIAFFTDMREAPSPEYTIERKDNDGPYSPENCRWAHKSEQAGNTRKNKLITFNNKTQTMAAWARETGIDASTIRSRIIDCGWSIKDALTIPSSPSNRKKHVYLTHQGITLTMAKWAIKLKLSRGMISKRLQNGASDAEALQPTTRPNRAKQSQ